MSDEKAQEKEVVSTAVENAVSMKITITADPDEQDKVDAVIEALEKARQRHPSEAIDLLIPALRGAHDVGRKHRDRIVRLMQARIQDVLA